MEKVLTFGAGSQRAGLVWRLRAKSKTRAGLVWRLRAKSKTRAGLVWRLRAEPMTHTGRIAVDIDQIIMRPV